MKHLLFAGLCWAILFSSSSAAEKPNIIFILVDDMGFSDLGCYGGEIDTPHIDSLAQTGMRFTQIYNTAKCFPSRACLLTGVYAQQCGMDKQHGTITNAVTLGEVLRTAGYRTWASGKHHGTENLYHRGFDHYYGLRDGCCNFWNPGKKRPGEAEPGRKRFRHWCDDDQEYSPYTPEDKKFYATDAFTNKALSWLDEKNPGKQPFFLYLSFNAPHYPLHAWPKDIAKYKGRYDAGYRSIQKARYQRMIDMKLIDPEKTPLTMIDDAAWSKLSGVEREKEILRMEIYAAMLDRVDQNVGRLLVKLREKGILDNTLIMFASDNGACAEKSGAKTKSTNIKNFGSVASYEAVGPHWASVQNTPLRKWKNYSHEGGINTPFIASWPAKIKALGGYQHQLGHFIDIMATVVELSGATYPKDFQGHQITPMQGVSLVPAFENIAQPRKKPVFWQWSRGGGIRDNKMKAVFWGKQWELYDMSKDRNESHDLSAAYPEKLKTMKKQYTDWYGSTAAGRTK